MGVGKIFLITLVFWIGFAIVAYAYFDYLKHDREWAHKRKLRQMQRDEEIVKEAEEEYEERNY